MQALFFSIGSFVVKAASQKMQEAAARTVALSGKLKFAADPTGWSRSCRRGVGNEVRQGCVGPSNCMNLKHRRLAALLCITFGKTMMLAELHGPAVCSSIALCTVAPVFRVASLPIFFKQHKAARLI